MILAPGTRVGVYQILGSLGAGGMGEVYRARDTHLDRDVALKILPDHFAADPDRVMRFEREAKTLAALNHPNIAYLHGLEVTSPRALVMELVEGDDLAQLIARGPVPLDEALSIARQIAEALEAAHDVGIIHRDLKPANIKVRPDGTVKVLDFGLAKALDPAGAVVAASDVAHSPTITSPALTHIGVILGTAAYMAPEQARGKAVDRRVDVWAFGCVLYELLVGRRAFSGETVTDTIAAIMTRTPDLSQLPAATPASVRQLLERCLERDPKQRLRDIGEARIALAADRTAAPPVPQQAAPATVRSTARTLLWTAAALALAAATGAITWQLRAPGAPAERRFAIATPNDVAPLAAAIAPDGHAVAFIADDRLWVQRLDGFTPAEIESASGARAVFWSPDSAFLGFQARGQLWKVAAGGGVPVAIGPVAADFTQAGGAAWLDGGRIVFTTGGTGLLEIPADGGIARPLLDIDPKEDADFHNVSALPDGRGVLFVRDPAKSDEEHTLEVLIFADGTRRVLHSGRTPAWPAYSPGGHILFQQQGAIWTLPFALDRFEATGPATRLHADARHPSVARDGTLVMLPAGGSAGETTLTWLDRKGNAEALGPPHPSISYPRLSPDGRSVAATVGAGAAADLWIFDVGRGTGRRLSFEATPDVAPRWTKDGQHVIYNCGSAVCARRADGVGATVTLVNDVLASSPPELSPDGTLLAFARYSPETRIDLWVVELGSAGPTAPPSATPRPLIATARFEGDPAISPDGRFIAYASSETGQFAVYISRFPNGEGKWQMSSGYGSMPQWGPKGDRFYFVDNSGYIVESEISLSTTVEAGKILGRTRAPGAIGRGYDLGPDGERFLLARPAGDEGQNARLLVVLNGRQP